MSRDYRAKRLARELDIPYTMALRHIREEAAEAAPTEPEERPDADPEKVTPGS
jgi:hypothetical protein